MMMAHRFERSGRLAVAGCLLALAIGGRWEARVSGQEAERESSGPAGKTDEAAFRWFSLPLEVGSLPKDSNCVPVRCPVDFTEVLAALGAGGAVDERTIRLESVGPDGKGVEQPVQFDPSPQPRAKQRRLLPTTTDKVSYTAEHAAGQRPPEVKVAGVLSWIVRAAPKGTARYRLRFGVARGGSLVQVPYRPHNLRGFDADGRATPVRWFPSMQISPLWPVDGVLHVREAGRLVASYHVGPTREPAKDDPLAIRRPFVYPLIGPDGVSLTEVGKPHDPTGSHAHHRSVWIAHASVDGHDFWSQGGGAILHDGFESMDDGPVLCRLVHKTRWVAAGLTLLRGRREWTFHAAGGDFSLVDLDLTLAPAGDKPVTLGKTNFGLLAARVAQSMTVFDGGGEIVNARGDRNEQGAHTQRAEWIDQSGPVAPGKWGGVAMLDHADNPNHPTAFHCRNDGWAGASLNIAGPTTIAPGRPLRVRYRLVLHRHDAAKAKIAQRYAEYQAQPTVTLGRAEEH